MKLVHAIFAVCLFTASCDIILNFNFGGSLRLAQMLLFLLCIAALARAIQNGRVLWPRGASSLGLWLCFQALFVPLSGYLPLGLRFFGLLLFTCAGVFSVVQLYGDSDRMESLMRLYLLSYVAVAAFGLLQFLLPLAGLPSLLVTQWISYGRIARINGFSYEPSYFATYMFMGWIMLVELRLTRARLTEGRWWGVATWVCGLSLFCSTSKTAWVFMIVEGLLRVAPLSWHAVRHGLGQLRLGRLLVRLPQARLLFGMVLLGSIALGSFELVSRVVDPLVFLSGTGLLNQPAHSLNSRSGSAMATLAAWESSPWIGHSMGGVPVYMAGRNGIAVTSMEQVRGNWGFPVLFDVLVGSGVFGFIPFAVFLYWTTLGVYRFSARHWPQERARWLRALSRAMIFEWMLLMTDQNLFRVYLWFHISMVLLVAYHLECMPAAERSVEAVAATPGPLAGAPAAA